MTDLSCPVCGAELALDHLFVEADNRAAITQLIAVAMPIGARLLQYTRLFTPPKTTLTQRKQVRLLLQLLPDLKRQAITHRGRDWRVPLATWAQGIDQMLLSRDAGKLDLPMKGHAYLYTILVSLADKVEATAEQQREAERRTPVRQDTVTVRGQTLPIGEALQVAYGGKDPELAAKDAHAPLATPMPAQLRERTAQLKRSTIGAKS